MPTRGKPSDYSPEPMNILLFKHRDIISEINHYGTASKWGYRELPSEMPLAAAYLTGRGLAVDCLDVPDGSRLPNREYDLIVYWVCTYSLESRLSQLRRLTSGFKSAKIALVVNDTFAGFDRQILARYPHVDFVIRRYHREKTIADLVSNRLRPEGLTDGIVYRIGNRIVDAGESPLRSYDHLHSGRKILEQLNPHNYDSFFVRVQQGCYGGCTFCLIGGKQPVYRNPLDVIDEISCILAHKEKAYIKLGAPVLLYDKNWIRTFCREILRRNLKFRWDSDVRADFPLTSDNLSALDLMHSAGCRLLYIGAETYDPETMMRLNKKYRIDKLLRASHFLVERGFEVTHQLLLGNPGDGGRSYEKTYRTMKGLPLDISHNIQILRPHPGTRVRKQAEELGLIPQDFNDIETLQQYTDRAVMGTGTLSREQVETWFRAFKYLRYYRQIKRRIIRKTGPLLINAAKLMVAGVLTAGYFGRVKKT